jgi:hypothetical protein
MQVIFHQMGGFAPVYEGCELDSTMLSAEEGQTLVALVESSDILNLTTRKTPGACDVRLYSFQINHQGQSHQVSFDQLSLPESVLPLLGFLLERSQPLRF